MYSFLLINALNAYQSFYWEHNNCDISVKTLINNLLECNFYAIKLNNHTIFREMNQQFYILYNFISSIFSMRLKLFIWFSWLYWTVTMWPILLSVQSSDNFICFFIFFIEFFLSNFYEKKKIPFENPLNISTKSIEKFQFILLLR